MEKPTSEEWKSIMTSIKEKTPKAVEIEKYGEYFYDYFTDVLPPIIQKSTAVLCSEPYDHNDEGKGIYIGIFAKDNKWYGILATINEFMKIS